MSATDFVGLVILMLGTTIQIYGTELEKIENIEVSRHDLYFELKWDPILYEAQSKRNVRYSAYAEFARYGRTTPGRVQLIDESNKTVIPFYVKPGREENEWSFTVSASIDRHEIAKGTKTYRKLTPPGVPITVSPPSVDFFNDCQFLAVNLTAPNEQMKYNYLEYQVDFTSPTGMKIYDQKRLKPDMVCSVCSEENLKSQVPTEKWIFIILIVLSALGATLFVSVFIKKYTTKNGTVQLPETIKQVITTKLRDVESYTANHNRYESPMKIEPVEYEEELADEASTNETTASSPSIVETGITTEYIPLLIDSGNRNFPQIEGAVSSNHQEAIPQANTNENDQSRSTISDDTKNNNIDGHVYSLSNNHDIDRSNGQVGGIPVLYISHQTSHNGSGYCSKYLPKHLLPNGSSGDASTFSNSVDGGYILKTCR